MLLAALSVVGAAPVPQPPGASQVEPLAALLQEAQAALDGGRLAQATGLLRKILELRPEHRLARQALVDALMRQGQWDEAGREAELLLERFAGDPDSVYLAAAVAFRRNEFQRAVELADRVIALKAQHRQAAAYQLRAFSHFMLEDYEAFRRDLEQLIQADPSNADAHYHLGRYYYENQQFTQGLDALEKAVALDPSHYKAHYFLGWCRQAQGDLAAAEAGYRRSIQEVEAQQVRYGWPYTDLGELLVTKGDYAGGLSWLYRGIRNDPDLPYSRYKYASALMKDQPTPEVEEHLLKAVELDPGYTEAFYLLGRYYQAVGDGEKAKAAFERFQELRRNPVASPYGVRRGR